MPFDDEKYDGTATRGDVAYVALVAASGLLAIQRALASIAMDGKPSVEAIEKIGKASEDLNKAFETLTGWHDGSR
ncbi:hypothetical protein [Aureimonas sp. AU20]|uniref:hypothetical protein n=1 Tax=Aureimonas sp. AU20 TaxID=1349819 RepID=UPI0011DFEA4C|nr:hypothetical protein [Aureimonas sp. AU20]